MVSLNRYKALGETPPVPPPVPTSEGFAEVVELVRLEADADTFIAGLSGILKRHGFTTEATRVLRYPAAFCPCDHHERNPRPDAEQLL